MLKLNFALYTGQTLLSSWWKQVKSHFQEVQSAHNTLCEKHDSDKAELEGMVEAEESARKSAITAEQSARATADEQIRGSVESEKSSREMADNEIRSALASEQAARESNDNQLSMGLSSEMYARKNADYVLQDGIDALGELSHTHENMSVLNGITAEKIAEWNDRTDYDTQNRLLIDNLEDVCRAMMASFAELYGAVGVTLYDGGMDDAEYDGVPLDGGYLGEEDTLTIDCGEFDDAIIVPAGAVVDGGTY